MFRNLLNLFKSSSDVNVGDLVSVTYRDGTQSKYQGIVEENSPNSILVATQFGYRRFKKEKIEQIKIGG